MHDMGQGLQEWIFLKKERSRDPPLYREELFACRFNSC